MEYQMTIGISASSEAKATELVKAMVEIKNSLSDKDLLDLAQLLKDKPGIVQTAKKLIW